MKQAMLEMQKELQQMKVLNASQLPPVQASSTTTPPTAPPLPSNVQEEPKPLPLQAQTEKEALDLAIALSLSEVGQAANYTGQAAIGQASSSTTPPPAPPLPMDVQEEMKKCEVLM